MTTAAVGYRMNLPPAGHGMNPSLAGHGMNPPLAAQRMNPPHMDRSPTIKADRGTPSL